MSEPKAITDALNAIEVAERSPNHPRALARQAVAKWRSDAQRQQLTTVNQHDVHEARVLNIDATLGHSGHDARIGRK